MIPCHVSGTLPLLPGFVGERERERERERAKNFTKKTHNHFGVKTSWTVN